jgi:hypothetical protein
MSLSGGSLRAVSREVRFVMVEECGVLVRLITMGRMSTIVPGQWLRMASVFGMYEVCCLGEVAVRALLIFPCLNLFYGCVTAATVCVTDEARFEEADEVGFVCGGS